MTRTLGILGGGQLGRMLTPPAQQLGFRVVVLDPTPNSPAGQVANEQIVGSYKEPQDIRRLAAVSDVLTIEIEHIDVDPLQGLQDTGQVIHPSPPTISCIQDKLIQKQYLQAAGVAVAPFMTVASTSRLDAVGEALGYPFVLKSRRGGFDGRGNAVVRSPADFGAALEKLGRDTPLYAEAFVPFEMELAVLAARDVRGEVAFYPIVRTHHERNICHTVHFPAGIDESIHRRAIELARAVMDQMSGAGVFAIEMFLTTSGEVLVNEIAPRVHNAGHLTSEACATSQFKQHVLAVMGEPLGSTDPIVPAAVMVNILGDRTGVAMPSGVSKALALGGVYVHIYGKAETRPDRKMGHITATGDTLDEATELVLRARALISI